MSKQILKTDGAPAAIGPYSQGVLASGSFVFVSGQLGLEPQTKTLVEGIEAQTERAILNIKAILEAGGTDLQRVVKVTVLLHNISDFAAMNGVYQRYFSENPPARAAFGGNDLPLGGLVEIECIAVV